jgi:hypothetical protein
MEEFVVAQGYSGVAEQWKQGGVGIWRCREAVPERINAKNDMEMQKNM